jgi:hypothetical protein
MTTVPNSRLVFDRPPNWNVDDAAATYDEAWAVEERRKYPQEVAMIDELVEGAKSGSTLLFARIDTNGDRTSDGWILIVAYERSAFDENLREAALSSVMFGSVNLHGTPAAVDVALATGPAARLDWTYDLRHGDGAIEIGTVRSYWLHDEASTMIVQLTYYGQHPELLTSLDRVTSTFRWAPGSGQPLSSAAERWQSGRLRRS